MIRRRAWGRITSEVAMNGLNRCSTAAWWAIWATSIELWVTMKSRVTYSPRALDTVMHRTLSRLNEVTDRTRRKGSLLRP